jgi:hypothetical protein
MAELKPEIGLVIRHAYLWWSEARKGREESSKDRPCVIVHLRVNEHQELETYICPVTHAPPEAPEKAIEIPAATKQRLRLDSARSWIITTEVNRFVWPGPDLRPVPGGDYSYGLLPGEMARYLIAQVKANAQDKSLLIVGRTE